jgi:hypothetical protein
VLTQWVSLVHVVGQAGAVPLHTKLLVHAGLPAVPAATFVHAPPATRLQRSHAPLHALPQQTESTQNPDPHWFGAVQVAPFAFFTRHVPAEQ